MHKITLLSLPCLTLERRLEINIGSCRQRARGTKHEHNEKKDTIPSPMLNGKAQISESKLKLLCYNILLQLKKPEYKGLP